MALRRSGRVVRVARVGMACAALLMVVTVDGSAVTRRTLIEAVLGGYLVLALVLMIATWKNWWLDIVAAPVEIVIDMLVGAIVVFSSGGFDSSFFVFGNVYIVSALIRWGWRESLWSAAVFTAVFVAASIADIALGDTFVIEPPRLVARLGNLLILILLALWIGSRRWVQALPRLHRPPDYWEMDPARKVLVDVADTFDAANAAIIWTTDQATLHIQHLRDRPCAASLSPTALSDLHEAQLFAIDRGRAVTRSAKTFSAGTVGRDIAARDALAAAETREGIAIPFSCGIGSGIIVASGIDGMSVDDLNYADDIAARACDTICGAEAGRRAARAMVIAANLETACNVHDTVAQSLSGTTFRLEALKTWIGCGEDARPQIDALLSDIRSEQARVRAFVGRLRQNDEPDGTVNICEIIREAAEVGARTWTVSCPVSVSCEPFDVPGWYGSEVAMIVTEAISNAARHGAANNVAIVIGSSNEWLWLSIHDDGRGFALRATDAEGAPTPWTLNERVQRLGGTISLQHLSGTRIDIQLPIGTSA
ncbi:MAG: histidine kinase [Pseudomonadota bacterium]